ncbi:MAG: hypothetical protein GXY85_07435 [Candidatus Brocadiaceae bacterium]|nr:hypothetical protein [Candidatus Brocadiaceae bacterium]
MWMAAAMRKLRIVVLEAQARPVAEVLGRLGVLHLKSSLDEGGGRLEPERIPDDVSRCAALAGRLQAIARRLGLEAAAPPSEIPETPMSTGEVEALLDSVEAALGSSADRLAAAEQALHETDELVRGLTPFRNVRASLERLADSDLLDARLGLVDGGSLQSLREAMPDGVLLLPLDEWEVAPGRPVHLLALSSRRRRFAMETVLRDHGFEEQNVPAWQGRTPADVCSEAVRKRQELAGRVATFRAELQGLAAPYGEPLRQAAAALAVETRLSEAQQTFGVTWATAVIAGWAPEHRVEEVREAVLRATGGRAIVEDRPPDPEEIRQGRVPSYVVHSRFLAPFQRLVQGYGVASYTELEPTAMFAVTFLVMFGVMFGDLGHGLCLLAAGVLIAWRARARVPRELGHVVAASGLAAMLFGTFVQGTFFGLSLADRGFPLTLGFEPIRFEGEHAGSPDMVVRYLLLAMGLGMALISLGAVLNIVNRLRRGDYEGGLLGRFGLTGIVLYWGLLGLAAKCVVAGFGREDLWLAVAAVGVPLLVLILHEPLHRVLRPSEPVSAGGLAMGVFEGLVEGLETLMVFVANTFSFLRVAAFALSHAALCFTVFILQRIVAGLPGAAVWSALVFVLGTAVIVGLEGLIVTIQILRLEYYEFFTKFFQAEGVRYRPFRLDGDGDGSP